MNTVEKIYMDNPGRTRFPYSRTRDTISLIRELHRIKAHGKPGIIKEFKRRSPSGFLNDRYPSVHDYFRSKIDARTAGMSILTEPDYFNGSYEDLSICQEFNLPILDKDFISTPVMVENAYNAGSDAILLIMDFLPPHAVEELACTARNMESGVFPGCPCRFFQQCSCGKELPDYHVSKLRIMAFRVELHPINSIIL